MQEIKVKPWYKMTELGVIPEDWEVKTFDEVFDITAWWDVKKECFSNIKTDKYRYPIFANAISNKWVYWYSSVYDYTSPSLTITARWWIWYAFPRYENYCAIVRLLVLQPKLDVSVSLISDYVNKYTNFANESTWVPQLTKPQISKYRIICPKYEEQKLIAKNLSDTDELINSLDELIKKKEKLKEWTMQELLTWKRRLPWFSWEWKEKTLKEICFINAWKSKSKFINKLWKYIIVDMWAVSDKWRLIISKFTNYNWDFLKKWDLIMPKDDIWWGFIIWKTAYIDSDNKYVLWDHVFKLTSKKDNSLFLNYMINWFQVNSEIKSKASGSAQIWITKWAVENQIIKLPNITEQKAISEVLSDMDNEIENLKIKRDKYKQIKEWMMQELLTWKTRLV